eukprot:scaffold22762_cov47-Phaeocystis_antarctica.AAC.1
MCDAPVRDLVWAVDRGNRVLKSGARRVVISDQPILAQRIHVHRLVLISKCVVLVHWLSIVDAVLRVLDQTVRAVHLRIRCARQGNLLTGAAVVRVAAHEAGCRRR